MRVTLLLAAATSAIGVGALGLVRYVYRTVNTGPFSSLPVWSYFHERLLA